MAIARVTVRLTFPGGDNSGTNTWHISDLGPGGESAALAVAMEAVRQYYLTISGQIWDSGYSARWDGEATTVESSPSPVAPNTPWTVTGAGTAQPVAAGVGAVVSWRSSLATKRGRGRTFHTPLQVGAYENDGTLTPGVRGGFQTAADTLVAASLAANSWSIAVYSPTDNVARGVIAARVSDTVAYLSSRRRK